MPKKLSSKPAKQKPLFSSPLVNVMLVGFLLAIVVGVFSISSFKTFCANSISCISNLSGEYDNDTQGVFMGKAVNSPAKVVALTPEIGQTAVLGENTSNKHIYVDLTNQKLYAKEGDNTVMEFSISSGKWGRTPTGDFQVWIKLKYTRMQGGSKALGTYYNLPNVPFTMYFYNNVVPKSRGYGIHGAYWHNNFGHPMSHGCINMRPEDAEKVFYWANPSSDKFTTYASDDNPGTPITIYGTAPNE